MARGGRRVARRSSRRFGRRHLGAADRFRAGVRAPLTVKLNVRPSAVTRIMELCRQLDPACSLAAHAGNGIVLVRFSEFSAADTSRVVLQGLQPAAAAAGGNVVVWSCAAGELTRQAVWGAAADDADVMPRETAIRPPGPAQSGAVRVWYGLNRRENVFGRRWGDAEEIGEINKGFFIFRFRMMPLRWTVAGNQNLLSPLGIPLSPLKIDYFELQRRLTATDGRTRPAHGDRFSGN